MTIVSSGVGQQEDEHKTCGVALTEREEGHFSLLGRMPCEKTHRIAPSAVEQSKVIGRSIESMTNGRVSTSLRRPVMGCSFMGRFTLRRVLNDAGLFVRVWGEMRSSEKCSTKRGKIDHISSI